METEQTRDTSPQRAEGITACRWAPFDDARVARLVRERARRAAPRARDGRSRIASLGDRLTSRATPRSPRRRRAAAVAMRRRLRTARARARAASRAAFPRRRARLVARRARAEDFDARVSRRSWSMPRSSTSARRSDETWRVRGARARVSRARRSSRSTPLRAAEAPGARAVRGATSSPTSLVDGVDDGVARDLVLPRDASPRASPTRSREPPPALGLDAPLQIARVALHRRARRAAGAHRALAAASASRAST